MLGKLHAKKTSDRKKQEGDEIYDYAEKQRNTNNTKADYEKLKRYSDGYYSYDIKYFK